MATLKVPPEALPEDPVALKALLRAALAERDQAQQRAEEQAARAQQQGKRADDLYLEKLRLQLELERYKKWYYGPRADRLKSPGELAQALLNFGEELAQKPVPPEEAAAADEPAAELRRVKRRRGRRALANFENLPVTTHVYELSAERARLPVLRRGAQRDRRGRELADRVPARALRAPSARAQEVRLRALRSGGRRGRRCRWRRGPTRRSSAAWRGRDCWLTSSPASSPITCRSTGWKRFSRGRDSRLRAPRSRSGAGTWPTWSNPCTAAWPSGCGSRTWWRPTTPCCPC